MEHGGARQGSGRKKMNNEDKFCNRCKRISFRVLPEVYEVVKVNAQKHEKTIAKYVEEWIVIDPYISESGIKFNLSPENVDNLNRLADKYNIDKEKILNYVLNELFTQKHLFE